MSLAKALIMWCVRRSNWLRTHPLTPWPSEIRPQKRIAKRYQPFFVDELQREDGTIHHKLPWWAPFNILMHQWGECDDLNEFHDHPRWTLTLVLRGELTERTPWGERVLKPGSIVFRTNKYIHGFVVKPEHAHKTWTLFCVGRRKYLQNTYVVTRRTETPERNQQ